MRLLPCVFKWDASESVMRCLPRYAQIASRQFADGEEYPLVVLEARSRESHNAYFAEVSECFQNLPEGVSARWPTSEHMRKWILIEVGWFDEFEANFKTPKDAMNAVAIFRRNDPFCRLSVHGAKVIVRWAKSQSAAAMGKQTFEDSKRDVLDYLASAIGVKRSEIRKAAKRRVG